MYYKKDNINLIVIRSTFLLFGFLYIPSSAMLYRACHTFCPPHAAQFQVNTIKIVFKWLMRTGGIQGSQGPSVERQTEMANGGGDDKRRTPELGSQHSGICLGIKIRVAQSDWTQTHTLSHNETVGLFLSWWHSTPFPSAEWLSLHC